MGKNLSVVRSLGRVMFGLAKKGVYSLGFPGIVLEECRTEAVYGDEGRTCGDFDWKPVGEEVSSGDVVTLSCVNKLGTWRLSIAVDAGSAFDGVAVRLEGNLIRRVKRLALRPLCCGKLKADHVLEHGRRMGGCNSILTESLRAEQPFKSSFQHVITRDGVSLQFSHRLMQKDLSYISGTAAKGKVRKLVVETELGDRDAGEVAAEALTVRLSGDGFALMRGWADENVEVVKEPKLVKPGWNSWDYYRWTITEDEVLENAEFIAADPVLSKHIKRIIVDDGWQYCYGEWDANSLFPSGMKSLAGKIKKLGFEPGLWFAPTIIEPHCRIAQTDSWMLAKGVSGLPCLAFSCMKRFGFVLDPTVKEVREWIFKLFERYTKMGFQYFKLDFLGATLRAPYFADPSVRKGEIIRMIVEPARRAAGKKAEILGCNYNFEAGNACVDAVRVSADIAANWHAVKGNVFSIATRFWSNGTFWINDPDFTLCRGQETSDDPDLTRLKALLVYVEPDKPDQYDCGRSLTKISTDEVRVLLSLVLMSAGAVNLSDKMTRLNTLGVELARKVVSAEVGETGIPLDLFRSERPSLWLQKLKNRKARVLLINWEDEARELVFDLAGQGFGAAAKTVDFWSGGDVAVRNGVVTASLKPHSCLMAVVG